MPNFRADVTEIDSNPALVVTPAVPDAGPELRAALELRRQATLTGRCQCGAVRPQLSRAQRRAAARGKETIHLIMRHEADCPAGDTNILRLRRAELS